MQSRLQVRHQVCCAGRTTKYRTDKERNTKKKKCASHCLPVVQSRPDRLSFPFCRVYQVVQAVLRERAKRRKNTNYYIIVNFVFLLCCINYYTLMLVHANNEMRIIKLKKNKNTFRRGTKRCPAAITRPSQIIAFLSYLF